MVITLVCDVYGEENNGTTITAKRLIDGLKERGHEVRMVSTFKSSDPMFYTVPKRSFGIFDGYVASNGVTLAKKDYDTMYRAIKGSDVVHIMLPFACSVVAVKVCRELDIPFTTAFHAQPENVTSHIFMKNFEPANRYIYHYFLKKLYSKTNYIHCPTKFIADTITSMGYKAKKYVISNGVAKDFHKIDVPKPEELKDKYCILFSGRYSKEKRHDLLIKAMKYSKYENDIALIFAGCGPQEKHLKKMGEKLTNKPIFAFMTKEELNKTINYADLYVHPADVEIEAISCIEALTSGLCPVISNSKKSATRFFALHDENLFQAGNPRDLAKKIDFFIENPEIKDKYSKEYIDYSKQFDIELCYDKMVDMFCDAIKEHRTKKEIK